MSKQTTVSWLWQQIFDNHVHELEDLAEFFHQAKQMEKEQIVDAHLLGLVHDLTKDAYTQAEEYYKETYGGDHE